MTEKISFFNLPLLVQGKIIREHVPFFQKVSTLSTMPEFFDMLNSKHTWLNPSVSFLKFYNLVRKLKSGFYLHKGYWWLHGFFVSINNDNVSFKLCGINETLTNNSLSSQNQMLNVRPSLLETIEFLTNFLNNYHFLDMFSVYCIYGNRYFFVNHFTNTVHWVNGMVYTLKENACFISDYCKHHLKLVVSNMVYLTCKNVQETHYCPCEEIKFNLKPLSLESFFKNFENLYPFEFELGVIKDDNVLINIKKMEKNLCYLYLRAEIFNLFLKNINHFR